jgi:SAM-dependent methyltransferase
MAFASNYRRWIMELLKPYIGRHIVEVGAGTGAFSEFLLASGPASLTVLEPSPNLYSKLIKLLGPIDSAGVVHLLQSNFPDACNGNRQIQTPDTAVYINVLEHIEDDETELKTIFEALATGGRILIFVPALPFLMSSMDRELGHFRRYTLSELMAKCSSAGFIIKTATYFDLLGVAPWWIKYRFLKSNSMEAVAVRAHDRWIVPVSRTIESLFKVPFGKNIILVGEKQSRLRAGSPSMSTAAWLR